MTNQAKASSYMNSTMKLNECDPHNFSSKVIRFSLKDLDSAYSTQNSQKKDAQKPSTSTNKNSKIMKMPNELSVTCRLNKTTQNEDLTKIVESVKRSTSKETSLDNSTDTVRKKRTAVINLKNLIQARTQRERSIDQEREMQPQVITEKQRQDFNNWVKGHLITPKNRDIQPKEELKDEANIQIVSRKPSLPLNE